MNRRHGGRTTKELSLSSESHWKITFLIAAPWRAGFRRQANACNMNTLTRRSTMEHVSQKSKKQASTTWITGEQKIYKVIGTFPETHPAIQHLANLGSRLLICAPILAKSEDARQIYHTVVQILLYQIKVDVLTPTRITEIAISSAPSSS